MILSRIRVGKVIMVFGALLIALLTLVPNPQDATQAAASSFFCLFCEDTSSADAVLNVLLYVPFAFGLRMAGVSPRRALLVAVACTVSIELLQMKVIPGRFAGMDDIITNSIGGALGIVLAERWPRILFPTATQCRWLAIGGACAWVTTWAFTALLLQPSPPAADWWAQVPSQGVYHEDFKGTVLRATLDGVELHSARITNSAELRDRVVRSGVQLEVAAVIGPRTSSLASIVAILNGRHSEALVLGQRGADLLFRVQLRAPAFRLRVPAVLVPRAAATPGDTVHVLARFDSAEYQVRVTSGGRTVERMERVSASWGWTFLLPFEYALGPEATFLTALWIAGLLIPLGYWAARASLHPGAELTVVVAAVFVGLAVVPLAASFQPVSWSEWGSALLGITLGTMIGRHSNGSTAEPRKLAD
jgi:hypothetical protein